MTLSPQFNINNLKKIPDKKRVESQYLRKNLKTKAIVANMRDLLNGMLHASSDPKS